MAENFEKEYEDRVPHSYDAEKSVISCILQNNDLVDEVFATINADMFYDPIYRAMFRSIYELRDQGFKIDTITLKDQTEPKSAGITITDKIHSVKAKVVEQGFDASKLDDDFFVEILKAAPLSSSVMTYCNLIKEKYILRKSIEVSERISLECRKGQKTAIEICNEAQNEYYKFSMNTGNKDSMRIDTFVPQIIEDINRAKLCPNGITGVRTGFRQLDNITAGFQNSDMIILAGRPASGKTAFALNLAYNISKYNDQSVLFFSLEMSAKQLAARILSAVSMISSADIRSGRLDDKKMDDFVAGVSTLHGTKLYVNDESYLTISDFRNKCMKHKSKYGLDIVFVDYLQLMHAGFDERNGNITKNSNRQEEVAQISRSIKGLAKDLDVPIIALSQLSREAASKERPQMSDIRESGAIEQDADIVMLINKPDKEDDQKTDILIEKHRNGSTGVVNLRFNKTTTRFNEWDDKN